LIQVRRTGKDAGEGWEARRRARAADRQSELAADAPPT